MYVYLCSQCYAIIENLILKFPRSIQYYFLILKHCSFYLLKEFTIYIIKINTIIIYIFVFKINESNLCVTQHIILLPHFCRVIFLHYVYSFSKCSNITEWTWKRFMFVLRIKTRYPWNRITKFCIFVPW